MRNDLGRSESGRQQGRSATHVWRNFAPALDSPPPAIVSDFVDREGVAGWQWMGVCAGCVRGVCR